MEPDWDMIGKEAMIEANMPTDECQHCGSSPTYEIQVRGPVHMADRYLCSRCIDEGGYLVKSAPGGDHSVTGPVAERLGSTLTVTFYVTEVTARRFLEWV